MLNETLKRYYQNCEKSYICKYLQNTENSNDNTLKVKKNNIAIQWGAEVHK